MIVQVLHDGVHIMVGPGVAHQDLIWLFWTLLILRNIDMGKNTHN